MKTTHTVKNGLSRLQQARQESLALFAGIRHRYETVTVWNGIEFVNDSKSTDLGSSLCSLEMTEKPVHWIIGETIAGDEWFEVMRQLKYKVVSLTVLAENDEWIAENMKPWVEAYEKVNSIDDAILHTLRHARVGSLVLFSPACSSYDLFEGYKERGEKFETELKKLIG